MRHDPINIVREELAELNEDMHELLKGFERMKLRIWEIHGDLKAFDSDLLAR